MRWHPVPAPDVTQDLILFDGDCVRCSRWARAVHDADLGQRFRFVALQSPAGQALAERFGVDGANPQTNVAIIDGLALFKFDVALNVGRTLRAWPWFGPLRLMPRFLRNALYDLIARNRYQLFGRREACFIADSKLRARILDDPVALTSPRPRISPFAKALGADFAKAPVAVRLCHDGSPAQTLQGSAQVRGADTPFARFVARAFNFPAAAENAPARVTIRLGADGKEFWVREIGGRRFASRVAYLRDGVTAESFGPFTFDVALTADETGIGLNVIAWRLGPLPLPSFLAPRSPARETMDAEGRFCFDVPIALPFLGRITHYSGHLVPNS